MISIDILYNRSITKKNGVNAVIKSFINGSEIFLRHNIKIENVICLTELVSMNKVQENHKKPIMKNNSVFKNKLYKAIPFSDTLKILVNHIFPALKTNKKYRQINSQSELIIFHDILTAYYYFKRNKKDSKKAIVVFHSNSDPLSMFKEAYPRFFKYFPKYFSNVLKVIIKKSNRIVFVAKSSSDKFNKQNLTESTYVYNGIFYDSSIIPVSSHSTKKVLKFVFVGTICYRKGVDIIFDAIKKINENLKFEFHFVGEGELYEKYKKIARNNVVFHGSIDNVIQLLNEMDVFVLPSRNEGLPISIIEAMSVPLPIIHTNVGGVKELVGNEAIELSQLNSDELKDLFENVIKNNYDLKKIKNSMYERYINFFTHEKMIDKYSRLVVEIINEKDIIY